MSREKRLCLNKLEADSYQLNIGGEKTSHTNKKHYADHSRKGHGKGINYMDNENGFKVYSPVLVRFKLYRVYLIPTILHFVVLIYYQKL